MFLPWELPKLSKNLVALVFHFPVNAHYFHLFNEGFQSLPIVFHTGTRAVVIKTDIKAKDCAALLIWFRLSSYSGLRLFKNMHWGFFNYVPHFYNQYIIIYNALL